MEASSIPSDIFNCFWTNNSIAVYVVLRDAQSSALKPEKQMIIEPQVLELYVDLLCEYRPQDVCSFIKMNEGYRLEETLQVSHCLYK